MSLMYVQKRNRAQGFADAIQKSAQMFASALEQRAISNDLGQLSIYAQGLLKNPTGTPPPMPKLNTVQGQQAAFNLQLQIPGIAYQQAMRMRTEAETARMPTIEQAQRATELGLHGREHDIQLGEQGIEAGEYAQRTRATEEEVRAARERKAEAERLQIEQGRVAAKYAEPEAQTNLKYKEALTEQALAGAAYQKGRAGDVPWTANWLKRRMPNLTDAEIQEALEVHVGIRARPSTSTQGKLSRSITEIEKARKGLRNDFGEIFEGMEDEDKAYAELQSMAMAQRAAELKGELTAPKASAAAPGGQSSITPAQAAAYKEQARARIRQRTGREPTQEEWQAEYLSLARNHGAWKSGW